MSSALPTSMEQFIAKTMPQYGSPTNEMFSPERMALLQIASNLMTQGGNQPVPTTLGQAIGAAVPPAMQTYQGARSQERARQLQQVQMAQNIQQFQATRVATEKKAAWDEAIKNKDYEKAMGIDPSATMDFAKSRVNIEGNYLVNYPETLGLPQSASAPQIPELQSDRTTAYPNPANQAFLDTSGLAYDTAMGKGPFGQVAAYPSTVEELQSDRTTRVSPAAVGVPPDVQPAIN